MESAGCSIVSEPVMNLIKFIHRSRSYWELVHFIHGERVFPPNEVEETVGASHVVCPWISKKKSNKDV